MNEIKVYHSVWKRSVMILVYLGAVALCVLYLLKGEAHVFAWYCAWFLVVFFSFSVFTWAYPLLKERITREPYLTITDDGVKVAGLKGQEFRFADVESFVLKRAPIEYLIVVNFRSEKATPDAILLSDLTIKPKVLFSILNERLSAHK